MQINTHNSLFPLVEFKNDDKTFAP